MVSPQSPWYSELVDALTQNDDNACWADDLSLLTECAAGYPERIRTMNTNALQLVQLMREHPAVDQVYFLIVVHISKKYSARTWGLDPYSASF